MHANIFSATYFIANGTSLVILAFAIFRPVVAQLLLSLLFIGAGVFNGAMAIIHPELFMAYGAMTPFATYEQFIYGAFSHNVTAIVVAISLCQLAMGAFISYKKPLLQIGLGAAIIFLLAITPLGAGSAFPSTLILVAAATTVLYKQRSPEAHDLYDTLHHFRG
ncbi:hypothetical protein ACTJJB_14400 [Chitinophaga sp. 22536]|uniref:hypothetical protein n=1 Tax=unclassified Chitinophaga TaxID=2619133 RepID=UPI0031D6D00A